MHHDIKLIQPFFEDVWNGTKTFEVRENDRNYNIGDTVTQYEYDPIEKKYLGRAVYGKISYILKDYYALKENHVVFALGNTIKLNKK